MFQFRWCTTRLNQQQDDLQFPGDFFVVRRLPSPANFTSPKGPPNRHGNSGSFLKTRLDCFFLPAFFRGWTRELMRYIYTKTTKVPLKSFNFQLFGLGFSTTESHFDSHDGMLHSGIHGAWTFGFPTRARWEGGQREIQTTVAGGCFKIFVCFFCTHYTPQKELEMFFSIFGASIWWSCKTEKFSKTGKFQPWSFFRNGEMDFTLEVREIWRPFWSNYRLQVTLSGSTNISWLEKNGPGLKKMWVFPKIRGIPKWMVSNGKPY